MNKTAKAIFIMLVIISAVFVFAIVSMQQSMAYHSIFASKKECRSFFEQGGNTTGQANRICQKIIPH